MMSTCQRLDWGNHEVALDRAVSIAARGLYQILAHHAARDPDGECRVGLRQLAAEAGVTERQVQRYLHELIAAHYLTARRNGDGRTASYRPIN